jgi:hypothetical protein
MKTRAIRGLFSEWLSAASSWLGQLSERGSVNHSRG